MTSLEALLGEPLPSGVEQLSEDDRDRLAAIVTGARERQLQQLAGSFDATLKHLPFPLRAVVRKVLL